ncbi:MAG: acylneuraminate cytidylyltransferase family protein [Deltaproteobacteria bacterium]|nr:acylneuraminate cytidylyltransferase family protein [Deltaproteobacteria bacterium]MCL4873352.1 acylneuraminate cytidylyltransferase family protein [bacterium]
MERLTALVPMRGRSERVPDKNIRAFGGKPLFYWILTTLRGCPSVDCIYVDTDSPAIKEKIGEFFGSSINTIDRPARLLGEHVSMNRIIEYDISVIEGGTHFLQTHSTNPLLKLSTIEEAARAYRYALKEGHDSLFSVTKRLSRYYDTELRPINHDPSMLERTQDLKPLLEENSNFYIFSRESFRETSSRLGKRPCAFEVEKMEGMDIDDEQDFRLTELALRLRTEQSPLPGVIQK